jgi:hypothetical protein
MPLIKNPQLLTQNSSSGYPAIEGNEFLLSDHPQGFPPSRDGHPAKTTSKLLGVF